MEGVQKWAPLGKPWYSSSQWDSVMLQNSRHSSRQASAKIYQPWLSRQLGRGWLQTAWKASNAIHIAGQKRCGTASVPCLKCKKLVRLLHKLHWSTMLLEHSMLAQISKEIVIRWNHAALRFPTPLVKTGAKDNLPDSCQGIFILPLPPAIWCIKVLDRSREKWVLHGLSSCSVRVGNLRLQFCTICSRSGKCVVRYRRFSMMTSKASLNGDTSAPGSAYSSPGTISSMMR